MSDRIESKLHEKARYIVAKVVKGDDGEYGLPVVIGEYPTEEVARKSAYEIAEQRRIFLEHINRGYSDDDARIQYRKRVQDLP